MRLDRYIGDKNFYRQMFTVALPILIQNVITNFVNLLDNIMVGQIGTEQMSGVAIVNQLLNVYNLGLFGMLAGIGIFTAQYYGKRDENGIRLTFRIKLISASLFFIASLVLLYFFKDTLIWSYLHEGNAGISLEEISKHANIYLRTMLIGLIPFGLNQVYASTLREIQQTKIPMTAGTVAVFVNLVFNYILIYGKFGMPALGVTGAAIATVISRFIEVGINIIWTILHKDKAIFSKNIFGKIDFTFSLLKKIGVTTLPLFINEFLWSYGMTVLNQLMSKRGVEVVSALNISTTITNLSATFFLAIGNSIGIIVGEQLGKGESKKAADTDRKMIAFSFVLTCFVAILTYIFAPNITYIYNTGSEIRELAANFIRISAFLMPMNSVVIAYYFTLRCGGKTFITFLFDSCYVWVGSITTAFILVNFTTLPIIPVYFGIYAIDFVKFIIGSVLVSKGVWINNLVVDTKDK